MASQSDLMRLGRQLRALRRRRGWRQSDLAAAAGVSQSVVSDVERGHADRLVVATLLAIAGAVDARLNLALSWRAGDLDRLTDSRHTSLATLVATLLRAWGWEVQAEVTFAIDGDRGSIDLLAWHPITRTLLVIEIKSEIGSMEATLRAHDVKRRVAHVVAGRFGWRPAVVARLIVLGAGTSSRRRVAEMARLVGPELVTSGWAIRRWMRAPAGSLDGAWIVSDIATHGSKQDRQGFHRVRRAGAPPP